MKRSVLLLLFLLVLNFPILGQQDSFPIPFTNYRYMIGLNINDVLNLNTGNKGFIFEFRPNHTVTNRRIQYWRVGLNINHTSTMFSIDSIRVQGQIANEADAFNTIVDFGPNWYFLRNRIAFNVGTILRLGYGRQAFYSLVQSTPRPTINSSIFTSLNIESGMSYAFHPKFSIGGKVIFTTDAIFNHRLIYDQTTNQDIVNNWNWTRIRSRLGQNLVLFLFYHF